ncbi:MAG: CPBP family intramembrane metalloprotease [Cyanobacterium sp. T60_A2020_053]|nr:CPBP family intramembrane metalloprotease [Cyanobacterium sp. T60_A2020_053]
MNSFVKNLHSYPILARLGIFFSTLLFIWLPFAIPIYLFLQQKDPNLTTILTMGLLFIIFLFLVKFWGNYVYENQKIFRTYGLVFSKRNLLDLSGGLLISFTITWLLFVVEYLFGWVVFKAPNQLFIPLLLEGLTSALLIALAEELFFRGWLLNELEKDFSEKQSNFINALLFAIAHFLKPLAEMIRGLVTFPALFILGLLLVWSKKNHHNLLGISIGLHGGFVWGYYVLNVGQMLTYTEVVPSWITGINQNPIAGLMGLLFLGTFSLIAKKRKLF